MHYQIRAALPTDEGFLWEMLYHAAMMAQDGAVSAAEAHHHPFLAVYVQAWGQPGDLGSIAVESSTGQPIGAAWLRVLPGNEHRYRGVGDHIPELALAVQPHARGQRVGEALLLHLLEQARSCYDAIVLSVRAENPAVRLYQRIGFVIIETTTNRVGGQSLVMLKQCRSGDGEDANADARSSSGSTP